MSGSGIGRGRGWLNINKNQKPGLPPDTMSPKPDECHNYESPAVNALTTPPKVNPKYSPIFSKINLFNENDDGILLNQKLKSIIEEFNKVCQSPTEVV